MLTNSNADFDASFSLLDIWPPTTSGFVDEAPASVLPAALRVQTEPVAAHLSPSILSRSALADVVSNAPLVSIDMIVEDEQGNVLFGLRANPPAQGYWFVPGGRIRKNESLDTAFARITRDELGRQLSIAEGRLIGVFEHFYDTDFNGTIGASTHYVVLAYRLQVTRASLPLPHEQHEQYKWIQPACVAQHPRIHLYAQAYFRS